MAPAHFCFRYTYQSTGVLQINIFYFMFPFKILISKAPRIPGLAPWSFVESLEGPHNPPDEGASDSEKSAWQTLSYRLNGLIWALSAALYCVNMVLKVCCVSCGQPVS